VATLAFDSARYVGARIGIYDPSGRKVGRIGHLSNQELLVIAGEEALVRHVVEAARASDGQPGGVDGSLGGSRRERASEQALTVCATASDRLQQAT
jgi:hypothetical protein